MSLTNTDFFEFGYCRVAHLVDFCVHPFDVLGDFLRVGKNHSVYLAFDNLMEFAPPVDSVVPHLVSPEFRNCWIFELRLGQRDGFFETVWKFGCDVVHHVFVQQESWCVRFLAEKIQSLVLGSFFKDVSSFRRGHVLGTKNLISRVPRDQTFFDEAMFWVEKIDLVGAARSKLSLLSNSKSGYFVVSLS